LIADIGNHAGLGMKIAIETGLPASRQGRLRFQYGNFIIERRQKSNLKENKLY